ncbi:MAG: cytidylyltransferase domain-containing protein [Candidatus Asgardarchaeia archaeon]
MSDQKKFKAIAVIPARGGSKGIPRKNIRPLVGKPLIWYIVKSAIESKIFDEVVVTTDDDEIAYMVNFFNEVTVIQRPSELAKDNVTLDPVVFHAVTTIEKETGKRYDLIFTLQPTSPLIKPETIQKAYDILSSTNYDSLITVQDATHLYWLEKNGHYTPLFEKRLNRQFLPRILKETGGIIATKREFLKENSRLGSKVYLLELDSDEGIDIDSEIDWFSAEQVIKKRRIIFRVDGDYDIGLGHVYRTLTLAHRLIGHEILFLMESSRKLGISKVKEYNYKVATFDSPDDAYHILENFAPHIVINDILDTNLEYMYELKKRNFFVVNFEDLGPGADLADVVFNALYEFSHPPKNRYYGYKYVVLRDEFIYTPYAEIKKDVKNIIITFGGVDQNNLTLRTLNAIDELALKDVKVTIIVGLGYKWFDELEKKISEMTSKGFNIVFVRNPKIMAKYIRSSDIAITSNGRTIYEIASLAVPCISISQNEREHMHLFSKISGAVLNLGLAKHVSENDIKNAISRLIENYELRVRMSERMKSFDLKKGVDRVIRIIFDKYYEWVEKGVENEKYA